MKVHADLNLSIDGFGTPPHPTPEEPLGDDWFRLVASSTATRTFRERVLGDTSGAGTTGVDDKYASAYVGEIGAQIMGAGMFGLDLHPHDPGWRGYWGENPPFHVPVFVLTHERRPELTMEGGNVFRFLSATPMEALALAAEAAEGRDVRIGGGPTVVREFLDAGLIDRLHVAIAPIPARRRSAALGRAARPRTRLRRDDRSSGERHPAHHLLPQGHQHSCLVAVATRRRDARHVFRS